MTMVLLVTPLPYPTREQIEKGTAPVLFHFRAHDERNASAGEAYGGEQRSVVVESSDRSSVSLYTAAVSWSRLQPRTELEKALEDIANSLGKKDWNFDTDPCSNKPNWVTKLENNVTCNCSVAGHNFCHVVAITLKEQNLPGTLPPELNRLHYLQIIDLSRNYLNGTIPKEWGSMTNLLNITLSSNRLTGAIPVEIANISTLIQLDLTVNQMSGNIPPELGSLTQIRTLQLSSNNFTRELPATLAKLTALQDFRIADNQLSGKIPDFIQNWTNINTLVIQGSGLSGPIPSKISLLSNLVELRISDLNGSEYAPLPQLQNMTLLNRLILRNCNINGKLPEYIVKMTTLKHIDLSFNRLSGMIPRTYADMSNANYMYEIRIYH